ncbi:hypothetical protein G6F35_017746 [Rhizopus arrhizus]|nr:hypothetical protein G6F40_016735 [Rhizopus arrhizus]KAG1167399.1 hypothetical protein G6F35_017746 [Rhizopus arrhizus]
MPMATQDDIAGLLRRIDYRSVDLRDVDSVAAAVSDLVHRKPGQGRRPRRAGTADAGKADRQRQRKR